MTDNGEHVPAKCDWTGFRRELFGGTWVDSAYRCENEGTEEHDWLRYCPKHLRAQLRREAKA